MLRKIIATFALLCIAAPALADGHEEEPALTLEVLRTSEGSLHVNTALIMGETDAVLVDPPFTMADAHRVAAMVLDSGKNLTHIFVTHDHPDHFFAMEVLQDVFPNAEIVAHETVVADIWRSLPYKVARWSPALGDNGPVHPSAPNALTSDVITLEGHELRVLGPMQGDHRNSTALWVPEIRALIPGDLVFNEVHLWLGEHDLAAVAGWRASMDVLEQLEPEIVVAGHARPGLPDDISGIEFTYRYLDAWPELVAQAEDGDDLIRLVRERFPTTIDVLDNFILVNSAQVHMGEQPIWTE